MTTPETVQVNRFLNTLNNSRAAHQEERALRLGELGDIARLENATRAGVVTALLKITENWRNRFYLGGLAPRAKAKVGSSVFSDSAGNELPAEALGADGKPLPMPQKPRR